MKYTINKETFEGLPEEIQKEYTLDGDTATLKIEGDNVPTQSEIDRYKHKFDLEVKHRKKAESDLLEAEKNIDKLSNDLQGASGKDEIEKIRAKHTEELEKIRAERENEKAEARALADSQLISETATKFCNDHFTIPAIMKDQFWKITSC